MDFFKRLKGLFKREAESQPNSTLRTSGHAPWWDSSVGGNAMSVAAVFRCVKLLSDVVANLPLEYKTRRRDVLEFDYSTPWNYLVGIQPNAWTSSVDFWRNVVSEILLQGNAYIVPQYGEFSGKPIGLYLCKRGTVTHNTMSDTYRVYDAEQGIDGTFDESEIIHLKHLSSTADPKRGVSVLTHARQTWETATAGNNETKKRFSSGGRIRAILTNSRDNINAGLGDYDDSELDEQAQRIQQRLTGNNDDIIAVSGQTDLKQLSSTSSDMQFLESRKFTVLEICRFFGVHPSFLFADVASNYKSAEQANVAFLTMTLDPILKSIEKEFQRKLVTPQQAFNRVFQFDRRAFYALDLDSKAKYQTAMVSIGAYTANDVRRQENLPSVPGGDTVLVSANLRPISDYEKYNYNSNEGK